LGVPGRYRVQLYRRQSGMPIACTYSDPLTGAYSFTRLAYRYQGYFTIAFDYGTAPVNAAIADLLTPEPMP
jgi:hypothetical protein